MTIGDLAQVNVIYDNSARSDQEENTFGFKAISVGATFTNLATAFKTAMVKNTSGGLLYQACSILSSSRLTVRDVVPGTQAEHELDYTAVVGGLALEALPPQCAAVISWRTGLAGRSFRGRTYLPAIAEASQANGTLTGAAVTAFETVPAQLLAVFGVGGSDLNWQFCIISRVHLGVPRTPPIGTVVTASVLDSEIKTQRRRNN